MKSLLIGITGNSGCGQSTVARFALNSGVRGVCSLDEIGHRLLERNYVRTALAKALCESNLKNIPPADLRKYLSEMAFEDRSVLTGINSVLHPRMKRWASISAVKLRDMGEIWILEGALLCELGITQLLDRLIVIRDTKERASARLVLRDGVTPDIVDARWQNQWTLSDKIKLSDYVIDNDSDLHSLQENTSVIFQKLISVNTRNTKRRNNGT